jgi:hypothetical protein
MLAGLRRDASESSPELYNTGLKLGWHLVHVEALSVGDEGAGAHNIKGGDTEETVRVVHAGSLEDLDPATPLATVLLRQITSKA